MATWVRYLSLTEGRKENEEGDGGLLPCPIYCDAPPRLLSPFVWSAPSTGYDGRAATAVQVSQMPPLFLEILSPSLSLSLSLSLHIPFRKRKGKGRQTPVRSSSSHSKELVVAVLCPNAACPFPDPDSHMHSLARKEENASYTSLLVCGLTRPFRYLCQNKTNSNTVQCARASCPEEAGGWMGSRLSFVGSSRHMKWAGCWPVKWRQVLACRGKMLQT